MKSAAKLPLLRVLASPQLTLLLLVVFGAAIAIATFIESGTSTAAAKAYVYNALWFEIMLGLFALNLILALSRWWPFRPHLAGFALIHIAVIVILAGAAITRFMGYEGSMFIREGESSDTIFTFKDHVRVSAGNQTLHFPVELHRVGEQDLVRQGDLGGQELTVAVTEFWPRFGREYVADPGGHPLVVLETPVGETVALGPGDRAEVEGLRLRHAPVDAGQASGVEAFGSLVVRTGTDWNHIPISPDLPLVGRVGQLTVTVTEFAADFGTKAGGESRRMTNPMLRVRLEATDGTTAEQTVFAYREDLSSRAADLPGDLADVRLGYLFEPEILITGVATEPIVRSNVGLTRVAPDGTESATAAGESFTPVAGEEWSGPRGEFRCMVRKILASGMLAAQNVDDPDADPAVRVQVTDAAGRSAEAVATKSMQGGVPIALGDRTMTVGFGPIRHKLPFRVHLDDFVLVTYPGSDNPVDYESHVRLYDEEHGIAGEPFRIYMNHPLSHRGFKHFQSSYNNDLSGTVLTVNYDPGKIPTYIGYALISLGFVLAFVKGRIRAWRSRRSESGQSRPRDMQGKIAALLLTAALGGTVSGAADAAQIRPLELGGRYDGDLQAPPAIDVTRLPAGQRSALGRLVIQDYQGRMMPLDTYSRALVRKTVKKFTLPGWEPGDLVLSWIANPQHWWEQPLLRVRHAGLKEMLGVGPETTHVAPRRAFDDRGQYRLATVVDKAHRTSDRERTKLQRKLIAFDERLNLIFLAMTTRSLRVFPVPSDDNQTWLGPTDVFDRIEGDTQLRYRSVWRDFLRGLQDTEKGIFGPAVTDLGAIQAEFGARVLPGRAALSAEMFLNRWRPFSGLVWLYMVAALVLMGSYFAGLVRRDGAPYPIRHGGFLPGLLLFGLATAGHTAAYAMRWLASGRAPLSNGYESLLFISLTVALTALVIEVRDRRGVVGGLGALLAFVILGISMMSFFDPAIGLLVPVLNSYWLNIHVTVITASYGVLGLGSLIGALMLVLYLFKGPGRRALRESIRKLDALLTEILVLGLGLLTMGTLLGGVWANESWGRYWGWDPKETWSLVTIIVYLVVSHIRLIPRIRKPWLMAAGSFAGIASVVMTFFGVNYFLSGLHSYAGGAEVAVPAWVGIGAALMAALIVLSGFAAARKDWGETLATREGVET